MSQSYDSSFEFQFDQQGPVAPIREQKVGIDYIEVTPAEDSDKWLLRIHFLAGDQIRIMVPWGITRQNVKITPILGGGQTDLRVESVQTKQDMLDVVIIKQGSNKLESTTYKLNLVGVQDLDPLFSTASFTLFQASGLDLLREKEATTEFMPPVAVDYMARDFNSFRRLMLDHLAMLIPEWRDWEAADIGMVMVEVLAYAADYLSYYQDAVATEAYLGTARGRISTRRHARLLNYRMHQGCNARTWIQVQVNREVFLPKRAQVFTQITGFHRKIIIRDSQVYKEAMRQNRKVFETLHGKALYPEHNQLEMFTFDSRDFRLLKGAVTVLLAREYPNLKEGDVLIFEQRVSPVTGKIEDSDKRLRHPVRVVCIKRFEDGALSQEPLTQIEWNTRDALPYDMQINSEEGEHSLTNIFTLQGNLILADYGETMPRQRLAPVPGTDYYRPVLRNARLTHACTYHHDTAIKIAAGEVTTVSSKKSTPEITLYEYAFMRDNDVRRWEVRPDLLSSGPFSRHFVVEQESDQTAHLRFGDGAQGRRPDPGSRFEVQFRVGNGAGGNVGRDSLKHLVLDIENQTADDGRIEEKDVVLVRNPLSATSGQDPEPIEEVRMYAPQAFYKQKRCVTPEDFKERLERLAEVREVVAQMRWTGASHTIFLHVNMTGMEDMNESQRTRMRAYLEPYRLIGYDVEIRPPIYVALEIELLVHVKPGFFNNQVHKSLRLSFSTLQLPNNRMGYFHGDNFGFGQPIYLSRILAHAMEIPGVAWVAAKRFKRRGENGAQTLGAGCIPMEPLELPRVDSNPGAPEFGYIKFNMEGGY